MTVVCQVEKFGHIINEIEPLIDAHWDEVGSYKDKFRRNIHFSDYLVLDAQDRLIAVTMRSGGNGQLVGYFVGVRGHDLHRDSLSEPAHRIMVVSALVYYVDPTHRGHARSFIRAVERAASARFGAEIINIRVKPEMNGAGEFFKAIGYSVTEVTLTRLIGGASDDAGKRSAVVARRVHRAG